MKKVNNKKGFMFLFGGVIWILTFVVCFIIAVVAGIKDNTDFSSNDNTAYIYLNDEEQKNEETLFEKQKENVSVNHYFTRSEEFVLEVINENNENLENFEVDLVFFDENNKLIGTKNVNIDLLLKNGKYYEKLSDVPKNIVNVDYVVKKDNFYKKLKNELVYNVDCFINFDDEKFEVKNNSNVNFDMIRFAIVYYDENEEIVDVDYVYVFDLMKNDNESKMYYTNIENVENLSYKVYINRCTID